MEGGRFSCRCTKFGNQGLGVLLYQKGWMEDAIKTADGKSVSVRVEMDTDFPRSGEVTLRVQPQRTAKFRLALRVPGWARDFKATVAGQTHAGKPGQFLNLERDWQPGDTVRVTMDLNERLVPGGASYPGYFAFMRGPQVLSLVANKEGEANLDRALVKADVPAGLAPASGFLPAGWIGGQAYGSPALAGNRIQLGWTDRSRDEDGFRVERKRGDVGLWFHVKTTAPGVPTCVDDAVNVVTPGKTYTYRVAAYNAGGPSAYSQEVTVTTPGVAVPAAPSGLKATAVSGSQINLAWSDNSDNEEGFRLECKVGAAGERKPVQVRTPPNFPSLTDYGLEPGQTYAYRVRAYNAAGESDWSNEVTAQTSERK